MPSFIFVLFSALKILKRVHPPLNLWILVYLLSSFVSSLYHLHWFFLVLHAFSCLCHRCLLSSMTLKCLQGKSGMSLRFTSNPSVAYTWIVFPAPTAFQNIHMCSTILVDISVLFLANSSSHAQFKRWPGVSRGNQFTSLCVHHFQDLHSVIYTCGLTPKALVIRP